MIFSDFYKGTKSPLAKLRHSQHQLPPITPDWVGDEHADLLSKDKNKVKAAVKHYMSSKIKNDWTFTWPPQTVEATPVPATEPIVAPVKVANPDAVSLHPEAAPSNDSADSAETKEPETKQDVPQSPAIEPAGSLEVQPAEPVQDEPREDDGYQVDDESEDSDSLQGSTQDNQDDAESIYSVVSEDPVHFQPRLEWASDLSDDETANSPISPSRFETPNAVVSPVFASIQEKRAQRRREVREEMAWNQGLACFEARRNAWTGARTVRVRTKPPSPTASGPPRSPRRLFFRRSMSASPPAWNSAASQHNSNDGSAAMSDESSVGKDDDKALRKHHTCDTAPSPPSSVQESTVQTLLPVAPPFLPPNNLLRATITPSLYLSLYDKVIIHSMQPTCPINLGDMLRSCVAGWKRDGEWPPQPTFIDTSMMAKKKKKAAAASGNNAGSVARRMSFGLLGRDKDDESKAGKGIRRSLQRVLGRSTHAGTEVTHGGEKRILH